MKKACQIRVSGPDATRFLNGQVTNDVTLATAEASLPACLLNAKGGLEQFVQIRRENGAYLLQAAPEEEEHLLSRLDKYLIADDVTLNVEGIVTSWDQATEQERIIRGQPGWPQELFPGLLPAEAGLDVTAVSFSKGCYTGQEVVSRMKRAGKTNRHLVHLTLSSAEVFPGAELQHDGQKAGFLTSVTRDPEGQVIALGYRLRKFAHLDQFSIAGSGATATIRS